MPATTALAIITGAFDTCGIVATEQPLQPAQAIGALGRLNRMMGQLKLQPLTQPVIARDVFALTAGRGGPSNPYTIGPGGDFDVARPIRLSAAGLLLVQATPATTIEVPRFLLTDAAYQALPIKDLPNALFTYVYYNPTYASDRGSIHLYPVPTIATNSLVLYRAEPLAYFATLTTSYDLPDGCAEALEYNLARRLLTPFGVTDASVVSDVIDLARTSLATFKRGNAKMTDLPNDFLQDRMGLYNITTGQLE